MKRIHSVVRRRHALALAAVLALAGCAGGDIGETGAAAQPVAAGAGASYAETLAYCGAQEPTGNSAKPGGFELTMPTHPGMPLYDVSAIVSPAGAPEPTIPAQLQVDVRDYRNVAGPILLSGAADPLRKMGVHFIPSLPSRSAACVVSLAKLAPATGTTGRYTLAWSSKWAPSVPLEGLPGKVVDGFEFVGTFAVPDATVSFVLEKGRFGATAGATLCYRAPSASSWDCAAPTVGDDGINWRFTRTGARPGVYVLAAPSAA